MSQALLTLFNFVSTLLTHTHSIYVFFFLGVCLKVRHKAAAGARETAHPIRLQARESENERLSEEKSQQQRGKQHSVATFHQKANSTLTSVCVCASVLSDLEIAITLWVPLRHQSTHCTRREQENKSSQSTEREKESVIARERTREREKERARVVEHTTSPTQSARATVARRQQQQRQHSISNSKEKRAENIYRLSKCLL